MQWNEVLDFLAVNIRGRDRRHQHISYLISAVEHAGLTEKLCIAFNEHLKTTEIYHAFLQACSDIGIDAR